MITSAAFSKPLCVDYNMPARLLLIFVLLALARCNKNEENPQLPVDYTGVAFALRNGHAWNAHTSCAWSIPKMNTVFVSLDSFYLFNNTYFARENLGILQIPPKIGEYRVHILELDPDKVLSNLDMWDGDQHLGSYILLESDSLNNKVIVTALDSVTNKISGKFTLTYLVSNRPYPAAPDTLRFTNGTFEGTILKK